MSDKIKSLINRSIVDDEFRRRFLAEPELVGREMGFDDQESAAISAMRGRLSQFLNSLDVKVSRMSAVIYCT